MTILTISESRAEALTLLTKVLLKRFTPREQTLIYESARREAMAGGPDSVVEELECLFDDLPVAEAHRQVRAEHG